MQFTISSLNLFGFDTWDTRISTILEYYKKRPDVLCLQETVYLPQVSPYSPSQLLNKSLGYTYEISDITRLQKGIEYEVYREGLATLSDLSVIRSEAIVLQRSEGDEHDRLVQLLDLKSENGTIIKIANVHFSITDYVDYASPQLKEVLAIIKSRDEKRIIIGDFNHDHINEFEDFWKDDYISTSTTPYITYPSMDRCIDYALVPNEYTIDDIEISPDGLSDHRAISVTISIPETI